MPRIINDPNSPLHAELINAFLALQLTGGVGLSLIVLTALASQRVKRNTTWYTFLVAWILSCISYTFIFLIGEQNAPTFGPCVAQAAGIYAAPSLTSSATLAFALDMLYGVRNATAQQATKRGHLITLALMTLPYLLWLGIFIGMLMYGINNPDQVRMGPNGTYCDISWGTPSKISSMIAISTTIILLVIEGYIAVRLIRRRNLLNDKQLTAMAVRVIIFGLLGALGLGVGVAYVLYDVPGSSFDVSMALLPVGGMLIFGTQMDLINVWMFWRPRQTLDSELNDLKSPAIPEVQTPRFGS